MISIKFISDNKNTRKSGISKFNDNLDETDII